MWPTIVCVYAFSLTHSATSASRSRGCVVGFPDKSPSLSTVANRPSHSLSRKYKALGTLQWIVRLLGETILPNGAQCGWVWEEIERSLREEEP